MEKFDTPTPISAVLDILAERVQFIAADRADTAVEVLLADSSKGRDVKVAGQTKVEYSNGVLRVEASAKNQFFGPSGSIEVTVSCPPVPGSRRRRLASSSGASDGSATSPSRARTATSSSTRPRVSASPTST